MRVEHTIFEPIQPAATRDPDRIIWGVALVDAETLRGYFVTTQTEVRIQRWIATSDLD
jgi:hypothetical protein